MQMPPVTTDISRIDIALVLAALIGGIVVGCLAIWQSRRAPDCITFYWADQYEVVCDGRVVEEGKTHAAL